MAEPGATLDYSLNLAAPLADISDAIISASAAVSPSGIGEMAVLGVAVSGDILTTILSGGVPARNYAVRVDVRTAGGDVFEYYVGVLVDPSAATVMPPPAPPSAGFGTAVTWASTGMPIGIYGVTTYGGSVYA